MIKKCSSEIYQTVCYICVLFTYQVYNVNLLQTVDITDVELAFSSFLLYTLETCSLLGFICVYP